MKINWNCITHCLLLLPSVLSSMTRLNINNCKQTTCIRVYIRVYKYKNISSLFPKWFWNQIWKYILNTFFLFSAQSCGWSPVIPWYNNLYCYDFFYIFCLPSFLYWLKEGWNGSLGKQKHFLKKINEGSTIFLLYMQLKKSYITIFDDDNI